MKSPIAEVSITRRRGGGRISAAMFAAVIAGVGALATGCADEEAEGMEAAYPVGATTPPDRAPAETPAPSRENLHAPTTAAPSDKASVAEAPPEPEDIVVGDTEEPTSPPSDDGPAPAEGPPTGGYADTDPSALNDFHAALDPYGTWVEDPTYGTVWVPSAEATGPDFTPYETGGHWGYDDDYVWESDYSWGWAPFHYGRWVYSTPGWAWVPGRSYAGAWVSWRYGLDDWSYVGWAPLSPTWCWRRGVAVGLGFVPVAPYAFVSAGDLFAPHVASRVVQDARAGVIAAHTQPWIGTPGGGSGRVIAHPSVGGPPPSSLRIPQSAIVRSGTNRGVLQAQVFARTHATPAAFEGRSTRSSLAPAYGPPAPSHFGGRFGAGFTGSVAATAPSRGWSAGPRPYFGSSSSYTLGSRARQGAAEGPGGSAPFYRANPSSERVGAPAQSYTGARAAPSTEMTPGGGSAGHSGYSGGFRGGLFGGGGGHAGGGRGGGGRGGGRH